MKLGLKVLKLAGLVLAGTIIVNTDTVFAGESNKVVEGVYVDDVYIGGMTKEEAQKALLAYTDKRGEAVITIHSDDNTITTTMAQMGYKMKKNDFIDHGMNVGTKGNVIEKYKELKDVENGGLVFEAEFEYDKALVESFVKDECTKKDVKAKEPQMVKKNDEYIKDESCAGFFTYKEGKTGRAIDVEDTLTKLLSAVDGFDGKDIEIKAKVDDTNPKFTVDQLKKCTTMLGTYGTDFSESSSARKVNVKNATAFINGTVIYPGEEFSTLKLITPFNAKNGYKEAGSYSGGKVIDSYGGGVCQVSTTLYNAIMKAELEVTVRSCHSMCIDYVPVSFDAAVSESSGKDFKFVNNTNAPIYVEGYTTKDYQVCFSIYGEETRPANREVKYKQVIIKVIEPGEPVITKDSSKYEGYRKVTQGAHTGYKAEVYKRVYIDGELVEETLYNKSSYKAAPKYITIGTKKKSDAEKPEPTKKPQASEKPQTSEKPQETEKPQVSEKPQNSETPQVTEKPQETEKPQVTETPQETEKPQATKEPESTQTPSQDLPAVELPII